MILAITANAEGDAIRLEFDGSIVTQFDDASTVVYETYATSEAINGKHHSEKVPTPA